MAEKPSFDFVKQRFNADYIENYNLKPDA